MYEAVLDEVTRVAVKKLSPGMVSRSERQIARFQEEVELSAACRHTNVLQFLGACLEPVSPRFAGNKWLSAGHKGELSETVCIGMDSLLC